jgi:hypothetical protein
MQHGTKSRAALARARIALETLALAARAPATFLDDVDGDSVWDYFTNAVRAARGALADERVLDELGEHVLARFLERTPTPFGFFALPRDAQGVFVYDSNDPYSRYRGTAQERPVDLATLPTAVRLVIDYGFPIGVARHTLWVISDLGTDKEVLHVVDLASETTTRIGSVLDVIEDASRRVSVDERRVATS